MKKAMPHGVIALIKNVVLDESNDVSISVKNKSVPEVLDEVFKNFARKGMRSLP